MKLSLFFCKTFIFFHLPSLSPVEGTKVQVLTRTCYELNLYITWTLSQQLLHSQLKAFFFVPRGHNGASGCIHGMTHNFIFQAGRLWGTWKSPCCGWFEFQSRVWLKQPGGIGTHQNLNTHTHYQRIVGMLVVLMFLHVIDRYLPESTDLCSDPHYLL